MSLLQRAIIVEGLRKPLLDSDFESFQIAEKVQRSLTKLKADGKFSGFMYLVCETTDAASVVLQKLVAQDHRARSAKEDEESELVSLLSEEDAEEMFLESFRKLTPARKKHALHVMEGAELPKPLIKTEPVTPQPEVQQRGIVYRDDPKLPSFSGEKGKDATFGRWFYEVQCIRQGPYPLHTVKDAIRKSLKSPAAEVVMRIGTAATVDQMIDKLRGLYGTVLPGAVLLQRFYQGVQENSETCAAWACRLEELLFQALEQGEVQTERMDKMLRSRFWNGLKDDRVKNATRHQEPILTFGELLVEARKVEEEYKEEPQKETRARSHQATSTIDEKLDKILKRLDSLEGEVSKLKSKGTSESSQQNTPAKRPRNCYKCKKEGHLAYGCREDQDVECYKCKGKGHIAAACLNE